MSPPRWEADVLGLSVAEVPHRHSPAWPPRRQFTDVFQLEVFILTLFKPFESTFISHISTYLDVIAYLYIFD
uniref:Uncharacterized protein n=1 Tax=Rhodnius prolixus TaxID=13249 RepID=T1H936_RHOPR